MNGGDAGEIGSRISSLECVKGQLPGGGSTCHFYSRDRDYRKQLSCISAVVRVIGLLIANYCRLMNDVDCTKSSDYRTVCYYLSNTGS